MCLKIGKIILNAEKKEVMCRVFFAAFMSQERFQNFFNYFFVNFKLIAIITLFFF